MNLALSSLHGMSLEIKLTVSLRKKIPYYYITIIIIFIFINIIDSIIIMYYTGCPHKHDNCKTILMSSLNSEFFLTFSRPPAFKCIIFKTMTSKFSEALHFQNVVCLFCSVNMTGDINNFV